MRWRGRVVLLAAAGAALAAVLAGALLAASGGGARPRPPADALSAGFWPVVALGCAESVGVEPVGLGFRFEDGGVAVSPGSDAGRAVDSVLRPSDAQLALLRECLGTFDFDDRPARLLRDEDRLALYDYFTAVVTPCLREQGGSPQGGRPDRLDFRDTAFRWWTPYFGAGADTVDAARELQAACPAWPPGLVSAPLAAPGSAPGVEG